MCLAIPSRVEQVDGLVAVVEAAGERRTVSLVLLTEPVEVGDFLLIQNGRFAYEKLDPERARDALALIDEIVAAGERGDAPDVRTWG